MNTESKPTGRDVGHARGADVAELLTGMLAEHAPYLRQDSKGLECLGCTRPGSDATFATWSEFAAHLAAAVDRRHREEPVISASPGQFLECTHEVYAADPLPTEPCGGVAVANRVDPIFGDHYPVCLAHCFNEMVPLAAVLAPVVARAQAEAWDESRRATLDEAGWPDGMTLRSTPNPYRASDLDPTNEGA